MSIEHPICQTNVLRPTIFFKEDIDVLFLTEALLRSHGDEAKLADITPPGYNMKSFLRASWGGGLAFL